MTHIKILAQNIGGAGLGRERGGGSIAPLRINIHSKKPEVIVLTETRIDNMDFDGKGVFRGYDLTQHSTGGRRAGGVMIFVKKEFTPIQGTIRNSRSGHFTIGAYEYKGLRVILGGIYGNCTAADGPSAEVFHEYIEWHRELSVRIGNAHTFIAGDFNIKLDMQNNFKPRSTAALIDFMDEFDLTDAGGEMRAPTWRRPHLPKSRSRIDYILYSSNITRETFDTTWGRGDHAELLGAFCVGKKSTTSHY